jgi:hypothetical protein
MVEHASRWYDGSESDKPTLQRSARRLAVAHGVFYMASGLWPVFHLRSFEVVTGPKADGWLVKTVGLLLAVIGATLIATAQRKTPRDVTRLLAIGSAGALASIDVVYASAGRISRVYFLDAAVQTGLVAAWIGAK